MASARTSRSILVVDDDRLLCRFLERLLQKAGYETTVVHDAAAMVRSLAEEPADLVLLDLVFPDGEDGLRLARSLRARDAVPIIMLSGCGSVTDKVSSLNVGADDYVTKPFEPQELLARVRAVLRRVRTVTAVAGDASQATFAGGCRIDPARRELLTADGNMVGLTSLEFDLLAALAWQGGRILSREDLLMLIANRRWTPDDRTVDLLVSKIRQKIRHYKGDPSCLRTVRGRGYVLIPDRDANADCNAAASLSGSIGLSRIGTSGSATS